VLIGVTLAHPLARAAAAFAPEGNVARQIANAHLVFNVGGVLLFIWFVPFIARALTHLIPDRKRTAPRRHKGQINRRRFLGVHAKAERKDRKELNRKDRNRDARGAIEIQKTRPGASVRW
jgi:hypothetical protein